MIDWAAPLATKKTLKPVRVLPGFEISPHTVVVPCRIYWSPAFTNRVSVHFFSAASGKSARIGIEDIINVEEDLLPDWVDPNTGTKKK